MLAALLLLSFAAACLALAGADSVTVSVDTSTLVFTVRCVEGGEGGEGSQDSQAMSLSACFRDEFLSTTIDASLLFDSPHCNLSSPRLVCVSML